MQCGCHAVALGFALGAGAGGGASSGYSSKLSPVLKPFEQGEGSRASSPLRLSSRRASCASPNLRTGARAASSNSSPAPPFRGCRPHSPSVPCLCRAHDASQVWHRLRARPSSSTTSGAATKRTLQIGVQLARAQNPCCCALHPQRAGTALSRSAPASLSRRLLLFLSCAGEQLRPRSSSSPFLRLRRT